MTEKEWKQEIIDKLINRTHCDKWQTVQLALNLAEEHFNQVKEDYNNLMDKCYEQKKQLSRLEAEKKAMSNELKGLMRRIQKRHIKLSQTMTIKRWKIYIFYTILDFLILKETIVYL